MVQQKQEMMQSGVSYVSGGGLISFATYADVTNALTLYALIGGAIVITIRAVYDGIALYRRIKDKNDGRKK